MDYLQYKKEVLIWLSILMSSFKPYYKWITFNIFVDHALTDGEI